MSRSAMLLRALGGLMLVLTLGLTTCQSLRVALSDAASAGADTEQTHA